MSLRARSGATAISFRQVVVRLDELEPGRLADALAQQIRVRRTEEDRDAVARPGCLDDLGADEQVAPIPGCRDIGTGLLLAVTDGQQPSLEKVILRHRVRTIDLPKQGEEAARPDQLIELVGHLLALLEHGVPDVLRRAVSGHEVLHWAI